MERHREPEMVRTGASRFLWKITSEFQPEMTRVGADVIPTLQGNSIRFYTVYEENRWLTMMSCRPFFGTSAFFVYIHT